MSEYMTAYDLHMLRDYGFTISNSGASWFGEDKYGEHWQAYVIDGDHKITFVNEMDRESITMTRPQYEELFYVKDNV